MTRLECQEALDHLYDYLKRELTPEMVAEVRRHLEHCRDCADYARYEERFLLLLEERCRKETCPKTVRDRIIAALRTAAKGG